MKIHTLKLVALALFLLLFSNSTVFAASNNFLMATKCINMAAKALSPEDKTYYLNKALSFYQAEYDKNNLNVDAMVGLGKIYCILDNRAEAKSILMQAYGLDYNNPKAQAALGDFNFYFQDYTTALEFYKLALSSGYLKNYPTNIATALCYEKLGDIPNAKLYYKISLMLNPNSNLAKQRLSSLENPNVAIEPTAQYSIFEEPNNDSDSDVNKLIEDTQKFDN